MSAEQVEAEVTGALAALEMAASVEALHGSGYVADQLRDAAKQLRRARFHERETYAHLQREAARAERYRLAWLSARRRVQ